MSYTALPAFIDTSALYAARNLEDQNHAAAYEHWAELLEGDERLVTSNCVLLETTALVGRRLRSRVPLARVRVKPLC